MKNQDRPSRRKFIRTTSAAAAATALSPTLPLIAGTGPSAKPALHGGVPVRSKNWISWPVWDPGAEESTLALLRSGNWYRGDGHKCEEFEEAYARLIGTRSAIATASGSTALIAALHTLGVDAGDEVIVSPYTFIATYNVVFNQKALPVFADTNPDTFTIDPFQIEKRINERTRAILPVHIFGLPADMNRIMDLARQHELVVVEDACQAWLAEYDGKMCGSIGDLGCFSFQNSKHIPCGEGGAIVGNDEDLMDRVFAYHNCGRPHGESMRGLPNHVVRGSNKRMTELQAHILLWQMKRARTDADKRLENALYLNERIREIPGLVPYQLSDGATRSAYHFYPMRYKKEHWDGLSRMKLRRALNAEGIPTYGGYGKQYQEGLIEDAINSRGYKRLFSAARLKSYREELYDLPQTDQLTGEGLMLFQHMLLAEKTDMDDIISAFQKLYDKRKELL